MTLKDRIELLVALGEYLKSDSEALNAVITQAYIQNRWFTTENSKKAISNIANEFLDKEKLENWAKSYKIEADNSIEKSVGIVMAGNIPLVGFHDFLCVFVAGHKAVIKPSDKDKVLLLHLFDFLSNQNEAFKNYIELTQRLTTFDAVIATGSNNTARYFEAYFGKYPNIIRKNRTSIAVISGDETLEELILLGIDVFEYFGLGCRNVSKLFVPKDYSFELMMEAFHHYKEIVLHNKYKNNYDYSYTLLTMNKIPTIFGTCVLMTENDGLQGRISQLFYNQYEDEKSLKKDLLSQKEGIQCVVSNSTIEGLPNVGFGQTQQPSLSDYADGVDTMAFLTSSSFFV
jgi:hypothetical protein